MFRSLNSALNFVMKERAGQGIGVETEQAKFISEEQENYSWEHGFFSLGIPHTICFKGWARAQKLEA